MTTRAHIQGLTLVETIVVVTIFSLLMIGVANSIAAFYRFNAYTIAQAYQVAEARRGVERLVRDVREMTYADDGTFPLARMEEHLIGFYSDIFVFWGVRIEMNEFKQSLDSHNWSLYHLI